MLLYAMRSQKWYTYVAGPTSSGDGVPVPVVVVVSPSGTSGGDGVP